jgi:OOP family OmpA-OmpF porin
MNNERNILKSLLLKEELEVLEQLKQKLLSKEQFTEEVAKVLSKAIKRAHQKDVNFEKALEKPIREGVIKAFSESKQSIIDALLPIMGQLIRKTVTNSIKQFVADINRAIDQGFSTKAIKWRWQAKKAGISFPEMVFQKTIRYQIEQIFLINRENGLLIEHVGKDDLLKDNNAISAMLTAIQDFIGDSLDTPEANLQSAEIENVEYLISSGPKAYLAAVVKGSPTERLKEKLQKLIENIHADFSGYLVKEDEYRNIPDLNDYLRGHLVTKSLEEEQTQTNWLPWDIIPLLILSGLIYWSYTRNKN